MDFSSLTRRELQALCKKNKLPANLTNVAMADSLKALEHVEGLEELLNQSPEKTMNGLLSIARTAARTSTSRKPINEEPESSQPLTRSRRPVTRRAVSEEVEQEKTEVPKTPAAPSTRKRAPAAYALQKTETQEKTAVQSVYNTRRSVRLLEKTMTNLSLDYGNSMPFKMDELSTEINNGSEKSDGSADQGSDMQTESEVSSDRVDVSEVLSESKSNGPLENEGSNNKIDMIEVGDVSKTKSELESEVAETKSASDVIIVSEVMDESHEEGSYEADDKGPRDEERENPLAAKVSDDVSAGEEAENLEEESQSLAIKESDIAEDQDFKNDESDSKFATPGETEEVKNVAATEEAANPETLTLNFSDEQQHIISSKDLDMSGAEGGYRGKFDFESDSITEEDSDDSSTEGESSEKEAMDENPIECEDKKTDNMQSGEDDDNLTEVADGMPKSVNQMTPHSAKMQTLNNTEADIEGALSMDKAPRLPPLAADQLGLQFPRPTLSKHGKSSGKKQSEIMSYVFDDNEESIDSSDKKWDNGGVEMKRDYDTTNKDKEEYEAKSLRQLKKMLKHQLKIGDNKMIKTEDKMVEMPRSALQEVPENQMA